MRRWRNLRLRRGQFYGPAQSPVPPAVPPRIIKPAGSRPRLGARLLPSRRRRVEPAWPQANQGQPWPSFTRQPGTRARFTRLATSRGRLLPLPPTVAPPVITTLTLPPAPEGVFYTASLAATGGTLPYTWSLLSGSLPAGLSLSGAGVISGIAPGSGTSSFTAEVTGANGLTATQALTLTVDAVYYDLYGDIYGTPGTSGGGGGGGGGTSFPASILDVRAELNLGAWTDISSYVLQRDGSTRVSVTRGRPDESAQASPSSVACQLNNRDGRFTSRNPLGPYYGQLGRNTPIRFSVPEGSVYLRMEDNSLDTATKAATPSTAALNVSGDLDVRLDCAISNWQPAVLAAKYTTSGNNRSWALVLDDSGYLELWWSTDGTAATVATATSTLPLPPGRTAIRATLALASGTVTFYTAAAGGAPGATWAQLGTATVTGATSIFAGTGELGVGRAGGVSQDNGAYYSPNGKFYELTLKNGIAGTTVCDVVFSAQAEGAGSFADAQGNTWALSGAAEISSRKYRGHFELSSLPQEWDPSGADIWTPVTAGGLLRRLAQGSAPVDSPMRRAQLAQSGTLAPVAYWPCEDGSGATGIASAVGGQAMVLYGTPKFGADSSFACSDPLPQWSSSAWIGAVPAYTSSGSLVVRFLLDVTSGPADATVIMRVLCTGTVREFTLRYRAGGNLSVSGWDSSGANLFDSGPVIPSVDSTPYWVSMELTPSGSHVTWTLSILQPGQSTGFTTTATISGATIGNAVEVQVNPGQVAGTVGMGHISVQGDWESLFTPALYRPLNSWTGELAGDRFARLCAENGVPCRIVGAPAVTAAMGAQAIDILPNLLQSCEDADRGLVFEPRQALAVGYRTYASLLTQSPAVTISYSLAQLVGLVPQEDDQFTRNDVTVSRPNGSSFRATLNDGSAMSVSPPPVGVGAYTFSVSVNAAHDSQLPDIAGWVMHLGTVNEERYPAVSVNLARGEIASLYDALQDADIGDYIQVTSPPKWLPPGPLRMLLYGVSPEEFGGYIYALTWNCVPESPYETGIWGDAVHGVLDTDGSSLAAPAGAGDTTLSVATAAPGALWDTGAGNYPVDVLAGGEQITVTAVSGTVSPQAFTVARSVNGVVKAHPAGEDVRLAYPMIAAIL